MALLAQKMIYFSPHWCNGWSFSGDFVKWYHVLVRLESVSNMENYSQKRGGQNKLKALSLRIANFTYRGLPADKKTVIKPLSYNV